MSHVRVLIADDHAQMLSALVSAVDADARFEVVGTAGTGPETARLAAELAVDLVLLDVRMPGGGAPVVAAIADLPRPPTVVAISAETGAGTVASVVTAGATGYLAKGRLGDALPDLLARCAQGEVVLATTTAAAALRSSLRAGRLAAPVGAAVAP